MSSPSLPARSLPSPWPPVPALYVVRPTSLSSEVMSSTARRYTDPPSPPRPPSGPPLGTYFRRRNDRPPSPPLPPCTVMSRTSRNGITGPPDERRGPRSRAAPRGLLLARARGPARASVARSLQRLDVHEATLAALVGEPDRAVPQRVQREVAAEADVLARLEPGAALADEDAAGRDELAVEALDAEPLGVAVGAVLGAAYALLVSHLQPSSALDLGDAHLGEALPVPDVTPVVGLRPELVDVHLLAAAVAQHLGGDLRALHGG